MARWSSPVIMRYARLRPLSNITDHVRELQTSNDMANIVDRIRREIMGVTQQLAKMDDSTRRLLSMEAKIADVESQAEADKRLPEYVVNDDSKCCRRVLIKTGSPVDWATSCSFRFGLGHHTFVADPISGYKNLCHRCLPKLRAERKAGALPAVSCSSR